MWLAATNRLMSVQQNITTYSERIVTTGLNSPETTGAQTLPSEQIHTQSSRLAAGQEVPPPPQHIWLQVEAGGGEDQVIRQKASYSGQNYRAVFKETSTNTRTDPGSGTPSRPTSQRPETGGELTGGLSVYPSFTGSKHRPEYWTMSK